MTAIRGEDAAAPQTVAAAMAAACHLVAGIAVGGSFRLPVDAGAAVRFTSSPVAAILIGVFAAVMTFLGLSVAVIPSRSRLATRAALIAVAGAAIAVGNGIVGITLVSVARSHFDLGTALERTKQAVGAASYLLPPGLLWCPSSLLLLVTAAADAHRPDRERVARALGFGAAALAATAELCALTFRGRTMTTVAVGLAAAGAAVAAADAARRVAAFRGASAALALLGRVALALAVGQVWVVGVHQYLRG